MSATFTNDQQQKHRAAFIEECRQKAWGAACHAEWIGKQLDTMMAEFEKLKAEDAKLASEIHGLELAIDSHTKDNRDKRKALQERRTALAKGMQAISQNMQQGQKALAGLYQSVEASLQLAAHAEGWSWKETETEGSTVN